MGEGVCVQSCSDGPLAICRILQAIIGGILIFIGIIMQFWSSNNVANIPLATLCATYSGSSEVMGLSDFNALFTWVQTVVPACAKLPPGACLSYEGAAGFFLNANQRQTLTGQVDRLRYAPAAFYCKYAPAEAVGVNTSTTCGRSGVAGPCRLWPGQPASGNPNWYLSLATATYPGPIYSVNCYDKVNVFQNFLTALLGTRWTQENIQAAAGKFLTACVADKGGDSYILTIGPCIALLGAIITILTMFRAFNGPPWPDVGTNLLQLSIVLLLVGFWSITLATTSHVSGMYQVCSGMTKPLTYNGRWYDNTPCMDLDSNGRDSWNPFVLYTLALQSTYIAGGVLTFLSVLLFLGLTSGVSDGMVGDRFGKYLVTLQDIPTKIRLPFPPRPT